MAGTVTVARATLYSFFAQALSSPSRALAVALGDGSLRSTVAAALVAAAPIHRSTLTRALVDGLAVEGQPDATDTLEALLVEYTRLFGGPLVCPHYEADYVAGDSFRRVHIISDVAAFYAAFGLRVRGSAFERPDFIAIELEFMRLLAAREARARAQRGRRRARLCREAQAKFFADHLEPWAQRFADALIAATPNGFQHVVGQLLRQFVSAEADYFGPHAGAAAASVPSVRVFALQEIPS